jgi:hypothetical protein
MGAVGYLGVIDSPYPYWAEVSGFVMTLPCFLAGAAWHARSRRHEV